MRIQIVVVAAMATLAALGGCGKIIKGIAKGMSHEAENAASAASRSAAHDESHAVASSAANGADDLHYGPHADEEAVQRETPVADFVTDTGKKFGEEVRDELVSQGLQSAISGNEDDRN